MKGKAFTATTIASAVTMLADGALTPSIKLGEDVHICGIDRPAAIEIIAALAEAYPEALEYVAREQGLRPGPAQARVMLGPEDEWKEAELALCSVGAALDDAAGRVGVFVRHGEDVLRQAAVMVSDVLKWLYAEEPRWPEPGEEED